MTDYLIVKWLHILSSTLLFGTGIGTAYYLICAVSTKNPYLIAAVGKYVIAADWMFTALFLAVVCTRHPCIHSPGGCVLFNGCEAGLTD